jgi:hypothetical protein
MCRKIIAGIMFVTFLGWAYTCAATIDEASPYGSGFPVNVVIASPGQSFFSGAAETLGKEVSPPAMDTSPRLVDDDEPALPASVDLSESLHPPLASVAMVWLALPLNLSGADLDAAVPCILILPPSLTTSPLRI